MANKLAHEISPYLLQHQNNPVEWFAWGNEAREMARKENKPIFLSIGYSTCYWCHVMEHDSFEDLEIAELLNKYFVPIKVDREERPDLDNTYMHAVIAISGHGGWPMSVFLTPELKPFFGGTFFPKERFSILLKKLAEAWSKNQADICRQAEALLKIFDRIIVPGAVKFNELEQKLFNQIKTTFDSQNGGFGGAPKFPPHAMLKLLTSKPEFKVQLDQTLSAIWRRGLCDPLAGGFHRYCVDQRWDVPHFEKMLYDNAQLLEVFALDPNLETKIIAEEIGEYLINSMQAKAGGFFSAEDAGEVGTEGEFYAWSAEELLPYKETKNYFELIKFEKKNLLHFKGTFEERASDEYRELADKLHSKRVERPKPRLDDKIITSWNALAIKSLCIAGAYLKRDDFKNAAQKSGEFLISKLWDGTTLYRIYRKDQGIEKRSQISGYLDDYAFTVLALLELYQINFEDKWLTHAEWILERAIELFVEGDEVNFSNSSNTDNLNHRAEWSDNAEPSAVSALIEGLIKCGLILEIPKFSELAKKLLEQGLNFAQSYPAAYCSFVSIYQNFSTGFVVLKSNNPRNLNLLDPKIILKLDPKIKGYQVCSIDGCGLVLESQSKLMIELGKRI